MAKAVIGYQKELPEIPGRRPWTPPASFLVKDAAAPTGWREDTSGRRPSTLLLVPKLREAVGAWRGGGYDGASDVTRRLFEHWFEEDHEVAGFNVPFRYHFCQREAIETLVFLVEIAQIADAKALIEAFGQVESHDLFERSFDFQTTMDGERQVRRWLADEDREIVQDLPPENLARCAFRMATGSGKTWVMAMAIVWSHLHRRRVPGSLMSTNFLIVAPNVIVYQRLEKDFANNEIFHALPLIPPEWKGSWSQKVILRGQATEPNASGNLFLTNIQQLYEGREQDWAALNPVDALLGRKPVKELTSYQRSMLERVKELKDLVVINDEAHHVHDADLEWSKSLLGVHRLLPRGVSLWLDFSATPKDQGGRFFPWVVCDYPLAQAVEDRIVKAPIIVTKSGDPKRPKRDPESINAENVVKKYAYWIDAAVQRWKEHRQAYKKLGSKPVLFIMMEKTAYADAVGRFLVATKEYGFKDSEVLVIHTDTKGEITKKDLDAAREAARDIDKAESRIKAIVSVMMLREGWDVRNVSVVLGLRPFTADAQILPEQVIGRGLRLMTGIGPDRTQTLEVLGTQKLLEGLRQQLEYEGVGVAVTGGDPPKPVSIYPVEERSAFDIAIPITRPSLTRNVAKLSDLNVDPLGPIFEQEELAEPYRIMLKMEFATTLTEVHRTDLAATLLPLPQEILASIANKVIQHSKLTSAFADIVPIVRDYLVTRCFARSIDLDDESVRSHLARFDVQDGIARFLARAIAELTLERRSIEFEKADFKLSGTRAFTWRRNLQDGPLVLRETVFNYVATYNDFERAFAEFLHRAKDISRFASLATTEQGDSATRFRVDYLKPSGAIGFYHPDFVAVQDTEAGEVNWIIETKGREWEGTADKDRAIQDWCHRVSEQTGAAWRFVRINQRDFGSGQFDSLAQLLRSCGPGLFDRLGVPRT